MTDEVLLDDDDYDDYEDYYEQYSVTPPLERSLCVFDLDETLVHSEMFEFPGASSVPCDDTVVWVAVRPGAHALLALVAQYADLGVWSAGFDNYVAATVERFFGDTYFRFVWGARHCATTPATAFHRWLLLSGQIAHTTHKPLDVIVHRFGYRRERIVLVEDNELNTLADERNALIVPEFDPLRFETDADALFALACYMRWILEECDDVAIGDVDKTRWQFHQSVTGAPLRVDVCAGGGNAHAQ